MPKPDICENLRKNCKLYSQVIVVFQVSNTQVDSKFLTEFFWV